VKAVNLELTPDEWRKLRLWAAQRDTSVQAVIAEVVRRELAGEPRHGF
jgi:hypothetical protein